MTETILTEKTIDNIVNELVNSVAGNHELGQLGNGVDLQGAGYRTASWVTETNTDLGNTTIVVPNPHEYTDLRVSPIQGSATSLVLPHDEMILITYTTSNDFSPVNGYAFSVSKDGNITSYQTITIDFLRNTVTKTSERTECPAVYQKHVGKLISETYAEVQRTVETRKELLEHMPNLKPNEFSQNPALDGYILEYFRSRDTFTAEIAAIRRELNQQNDEHDRRQNELWRQYTEPQTASVAQSNVPFLATKRGTDYCIIGSTVLVAALLVAIEIRKVYHLKKIIKIN